MTSASGTPPTAIRLNLGGEAEEPDTINQQPRWAVRRGWRSSPTNETFAKLVQSGDNYLVCDNQTLPFPADRVDEITTNSVPIDLTTWLGPGVQSQEIRRVLKSGGIWVDNGVTVYTKP